jgi:hypothetical protein
MTQKKLTKLGQIFCRIEFVTHLLAFFVFISGLIYSAYALFGT